MRRVEMDCPQCDAAMAALLRVGCTGSELRLLCIGANGRAMADPSNENGRALHARCEAIDAARRRATALLAQQIG